MVDTLSTSTRSADYGFGGIDARAMGSITNAAVFAEQTYAVACSDMIDIFTSCTKKISGFTDLGLQEQASCYCCQGSGSSETWTDAMGQYASTCADWASTGEPLTAYTVAKTFATFCDDYTDVCGGSSPSTSDYYSYTSDSGFTSATGGSQAIVTVTGANGGSSSSTSTSASGGGSKGLSTGAVAGIAAGVGVIALLGFAGLLVFFLKKRKPAATPSPPPAAAPAMAQQNQPPQQPFNGQQQPPMVAAGGFQQPYNNQQQQQQQQQQHLYNTGHQSPPPDMHQQQQYMNTNSMYGTTSPVSYQPSPSPQQTVPSPHQTPSPYQPPVATAWNPAGHQSPAQSMAAVPPPTNQMHFAAELPTTEMVGSHLPIVAQELPVEDRTRYSELPSNAPTPQPQHSQPHH